MALFRLDVVPYLRIVRRRKWVVLFIFLAIFLPTVFFVNQQKPHFVARAAVKIEVPKLISEFTRWRRRGKREFSIDEELRFIRSPKVIEEVAKRLAIAPERATLGEFKRISNVLSTSIGIQESGKTSIFMISASALTAKKAAELANTIAQTYVDLNLEERIKRTRASCQYLEKHSAALEAKLDKAEQALKKFKEREGNIVLQKKESKSRLVVLELELSKLLQKYPAESPILKELEDRIKTTRDQLKKVANKESELKHLIRNRDYDQKKYKRWREQTINVQLREEIKIPDVSIFDVAIPPQFPVRTNKLLKKFMGALVGLMAGLFSVFLMESMETSLKTVEGVENFTKLPVLGVIPYLTVKREKEKIRRWLYYAKRRDNQSCLRERLMIHYSPQSLIGESYRNLRTRIQYTALNKGAKVLLVTSAGPREGKSITSANFAISAAQAGYKVLLIDADLRRPILDKLFNLKKEPGLADCLSGAMKWEDTLQTVTDILTKTSESKKFLQISGLDNLKLITSGCLVSNPAELLSSKRVGLLVEELKANFDLVLFDSPPVLPVSDAVTLVSRVDGVILVYQAAVLAKEALLRAKEQLESAGGAIKGIVLNNAPIGAESYTAGSYYSQLNHK